MMKLASNVVLQEELFLSQKGTNNSSYLMVTTPDKRYSFKIDFQQTKQTRERLHYFLQIWSDHENERRAFANNSTQSSASKSQPTNFTYSLRVFFYISGTATWMKITGPRARISCSRAHPRGYRL